MHKTIEFFEVSVVLVVFESHLAIVHNLSRVYGVFDKIALIRKRLRGPSLKYVTLFLANFYPPSPVTLCHTSRDPQSTSHISDPLPRFFSRPSTKNPDKSPLYKFSLNCLRGFCPGGFVRGSLVWKVLSGVVFVHSFFCHNTSVTTES